MLASQLKLPMMIGEGADEQHLRISLAHVLVLPVAPIAQNSPASVMSMTISVVAMKRHLAAAGRSPSRCSAKNVSRNGR